MTFPLCRSCRAPLTHIFLDLGSQPLANSYPTPDDVAAGPEAVFPLKVRVCARCFLVQADDAVPAEAIFGGDYAYFSSYSATWVEHARRYALAMVERFNLGPESLVVEVASNDGYLLQHFVALDVPVLGIEPSGNTADAARARGVPTEALFFNLATASKLAARGVQADLIAANNVLAHVPDLPSFIAGFPQVLKAEGVLTFEFPHLLNLIDEVQFDTIYHEHFSYLSLLALEPVLNANGLRPFDAERLPTHGGSLRLFCVHVGSMREETQALADLRQAERSGGLQRLATYEGFPSRVEAVRDSFLQFLAGAKADGRKVAAYGAAAKGVTFLNTCGVGVEDILAVFDDNPVKQGRLMPGSHVPILAPDQLGEMRPDYVVILPWNLREEIARRFAGISAWGGRFVLGRPTTQVLG
jgi:SAM-dependent methyltransferase